MTLKSTGFECFVKIMGGNYVFNRSSRASFNPTSHLKYQNILNKGYFDRIRFLI